MSVVRLLSTDFDGTLIGPPPHAECPQSLAAALEEHHRRGGLWAINTGRGLPHIIEGLEVFRPPILPDFLLIHEREIYRRSEAGWSAHGDWNDCCRERHARLYEMAGDVFSVIERMAEQSDNTITVLYEEDVPAGLVTSSEEVMERVAAIIGKSTVHLPEFGYQRNTIYMRFCHSDYHKGSALSELCRLENISPAEVFAVGDHHNDMSMLDGRHAAMTACPANAIAPVRELVKRSGGYVASEPWAEGVAEALRFFETPGPGLNGTRA